MPNYLLHKDTGELEIVSGTEPFVVTPDAGDGTYDVYRLDNSATIAITTQDTQAPTITNLTATLSDDNQAVLAWTSDEASGTAHWVCTTSVTQPSPAQIKQGQTHTGAAAEAAGTQPVTTVGSQSIAPVGGLADGTDYAFHLLQEDASGNASTTLTASVSVPVVDQTAPILSGVNASVAGTTATLRWSSDEGNGTAYWVCTRSATAPNTTQIIAGRDHTGATAVASGIQAVSSTGSQDNQVVTGLAAGSAYFFHLLQQDDIGNISVVVSTAGVTVAGSGGASAQINILGRSATRVAPEGFAFDLALEGFDTPGPAAGEVYDPRLHDLYYYWDFGDSYQFTAPQSMIPQFRNAGIAYGAKASHVYRQPGTYNVSCLIVEPSSGKIATANLSVTIGDADAVFTGSNNIYVDQNYDGVNAPQNAPSGALLFNDFSAAMDNAIKWNSGAPRRIILARGQAHTVNTDLTVGYAFTAPSFCIVADRAPGPNPILDMSNNGFVWAYTDPSATERDFRFENIDFIGGWDATTQTGTRGTAFYLRENPPLQTLFEGCSFDGFDIAIYPNATDLPKISANPYLFLNNSSITNWRSSGIFGDGINLCITGNRIAQHPNALSGYGGSDNNLISALRVFRMDNTIIAQNDLFSRTGWFVNVPGYYTTQSCMRLSTAAYEGAYHNVNANMMEGGFSVLSINNSNGEGGVAINAVVEKNIMVGTHDTNRMIDISYGGTTVRNNVGIFPDTPTYGIMPGTFVAYIRQGSDADNRNAPQKAYSNTFVNLQTDANAPGGAAGAIPVGDAGAVGYINVVAGNNISYQPSQGVTADAPFDTSVLWAPRYTHYQDDNTPRDNSKGTPSNTIALYQPTGDSAALGDAINGEVAYDDFFGNMRPQYPSRGAFEAS